MRVKHIRLHGILSLVVMTVVMFSMLPRVSASATDGTIDASSRYAWSENTGWIDFGSTEGNVHVTDTALSGYAWGENVGWISLNCSNDSSCATVDFKVTNNSAGTLGGYAWSENKGWIDFDPTGGGVVISSSGVFSGYAWSENAGWISFNCSDASSCATVDYKVSTDWRPSSSRTTSSSSSTSTQAQNGGGGGGARPSTLTRRMELAKAAILARFEGVKKENEKMFAEEDDLEEKNKIEYAAKQREDRIAERIAEYEASVALLSKERDELRRSFVRRREERLKVALALKEQEMLEKQVALQKEQEALRKEQEENRKQREQRIAEQEQVKDAVAERPMVRLTPEAVALRRNRLFLVVDASPVLYKDVPLDAWFSPYVSYVIEEKIAQGYRDEDGNPKGEFGVANPITYAEVLKMALEAAGANTDNLPPPRNVSAKGTWASAYVSKAEALSLAVFSPNLDVQKPASRAAVIQTVLEVLGVTIGKTPASYEDVPKDHPYTGAIAAATFFGLVQGDLDAENKPLNRFRPDDSINRAEVSKIIALAKELLK